jgi:hypothetical protein
LTGKLKGGEIEDELKPGERERVAEKSLRKLRFAGCEVAPYIPGSNCTIPEVAKVLMGKSVTPTKHKNQRDSRYYCYWLETH